MWFFNVIFFVLLSGGVGVEDHVLDFDGYAG